MLDTTLLSVSLPPISLKSNALVVSGCNVFLPDTKEYSTFDCVIFFISIKMTMV